MAKFAYQMQSILNVKSKLENQAKIAYSSAVFKLRSEEQKMQEIKSRKKYYEDKMRIEMNEKLDVTELNSCNQGIQLMQKAIEEEQIQINIAQKSVDKAQARLNKASMERKTHEKLRENAFEVFMQDLKTQESREIDEVVTYNYAVTI